MTANSFRIGSGRLALLAICLAFSRAGAEELRLDIGTMAPKPHLGFGWGLSERSGGHQFRWIKNLEADIRIEVVSPRDAELVLRARPQYLPYTRQTVSVLLNGKYVGEWVCPDHPGYATYRMSLPAPCWKPGKNILTFRMAYRKQVGPDRRELSLCVDTVTLVWN